MMLVLFRRRGRRTVQQSLWASSKFAAAHLHGKKESNIMQAINRAFSEVIDGTEQFVT